LVNGFGNTWHQRKGETGWLVILLDVAIVFENTAAAFVDARTRKWAHYEKEILAYRLRGYSVTYDAILKRIGVVSQRYLRLMKVLVVSEMLEHSSRIYRKHLGLRDLLPDTGAKRRPVGTTETDRPSGGLCQKKRNSISAGASGGKCLERRFTSPVGTPSQRGELQCQPCPGPRRLAFAGTAPTPPRVQPRPTLRHHQKPVPKQKAKQTTLEVERLQSVKWFGRSSDSRVAATVFGMKTPALMSGRRCGNEYERNEPWDESGYSWTLNVVDVRVVKVEAEVVHNDGATTNTFVVVVTANKKKCNFPQKTDVVDGKYCGDAIAAICVVGFRPSRWFVVVGILLFMYLHFRWDIHCFGHSGTKTSPSSPTTTETSNSPRTPTISKRDACSELPSTPDFITTSTSGVSVLQRTEEQVTDYTDSFPNCPGGGLPPVMRETVYGRETIRPICAPIVEWTFCPSSQIPKPVVAISVSCVSRWKITRKMGESEDLHGVRCDLCDYVGVSKRPVGMHRRRHANENIMQITGK
ncbi:hypothetical protein T08_13191, partial [Trichinella sp. T8]